MRIAFLVLAAMLLVMGCNSPADTSSDTTKSAQEPATTSSNTPAGGEGGTIAPMAGVGAGPMTPVSGSESLQGGGSGVGQVMKEKAKGVAGTAPSSINQMGEDGGE